ncbi:transcription elongation factor [Laetiporus sulphureus 93-53]|uniref:Transcription elongation factor n=1 Tax=Laetiporus sulphureus 93-53 TaxID=1314785 RepID=A0A165BZQ5_9APHY|nr:transcription elongation factor [Laetiporus sulphureus 93-53]KZT01942.1 transcription elongation factor [Laetiporus sulphureus 93-53]
MSSAAELKSLVKALHGTSNDEETITILKTLKEEAKITEATLRESKVGLAVGKLRSHSTKDVSDLAKEIVKKWKTEVEREKQSSGSSGKAVANGKPSAMRKSSTASSTASGASSATISAAPSTPMTPTATSASGKGDLRTSKTDGVKTAVTGDKTRDKCIELLYDALASDSGAPSELIMSRAKGIEHTVLGEFNGTTAAYKSKIRSFYVNLKDKNNPGLRESIVSGDLPVQRFCKMTSQEMASEERKAADSKIMEENLFKALGAEEVQAETDAFQCGRCKQRKCRYRQAQTRSADEPMTTFVTCTVCNNRWKFS